MSRAARLLFVATLVFASGCAKQDWIDRTLVTENVSGVWEGFMATSSGQPSTHQNIRFELEQKGPSVTGVFRGSLPQAAPHGATPIEGSMAGDQFNFRDQRGTLAGELTVAGDEMVGRGVVAQGRDVTFGLRRVDSVAAPR